LTGVARTTFVTSDFGLFDFFISNGTASQDSKPNAVARSIPNPQPTVHVW
jgi:hypothetical protein